MKNLASEINTEIIEKNRLGIWWIGQAGFVIKTSTGRIICIDPYLSNSCHTILKQFGYGFKRMTPSLIGDRDVIFNELLISHNHPDHLDKESIPGLCDNTETVIYADYESIEDSKEIVNNDNKLRCIRPEEIIDFGEYKLMAVKADHGEGCKAALGFVLDFGFVKVYYAGDTCFSTEIIKRIADIKPEISLLPINGAFGNLNSLEAVKFAEEIGTKVMIPYHYWMFPMHFGNPGELVDYINNNTTTFELEMPMQGELVIY